MKNIIIAILATLFIVGCGGSSSKKTKSTTPDFNNTDAKYDLNTYLQENSSVVYRSILLTNNSGKKKYSDDSKVETFPTQKSVKTDNVILLQDGTDKETGSIKILATKLERTFKGSTGSQTIDIVRKFDIDDAITNSIMNQKISNAKVKLTRICHATDIIESKEINNIPYTNLLEIECTTSSELIEKNELTTEASLEKTELIYMVEKKGIVFNETETCTAVTNVALEQETKVSVCKKETKEMVSFNHL